MVCDYPVIRVDQDIFEINEFDGVSMFLIIGSERALLVDTGVGIGDLAGFLPRLTDKPVDVVVTHNHRDHAGNAPRFERIYMSVKDKEIAPIVRPWTSAPSRRQFAHRTLGMYPERAYPWTDEDIVEFTPEQEPEVIGVEDGYVFDLGNRKEKVILVPGHTPGSLAILDDLTGCLLAGDCCNTTTGIGVRPLENPAMQHVTVAEALAALRRLDTMPFDRKKVFNAHTSATRRFGEPLAADVLPRLIVAMQHIVDGDYQSETEYIPVLDLHVDSARFGEILVQFHQERIR